MAIGNRVLREGEVPSKYISQTLQSFEPGTIQARIADESVFGLRFYGGTSRPQSSYMNPTFPLGNVRQLNALPPTNEVTNIIQWQVKPGTAYLFGRVRPNFAQPGGGIQMYIPNPELNLLKPTW